MHHMPQSAALDAAERAAPTAADCDVFIIGGGPAGSTAAALLARAGRRVVMIEKDHHPRFHIGESLLPANALLFDRLGLREEVEKIGLRKYGAEFVSIEKNTSSEIAFGDAWDKSMPYAWQVRRDALDELMFRHAAKQGAETHEGCRAKDVAFDDAGATVTAVLDDGAERCWRAKFVLDCSGRDTFLAHKFKAKQRNPLHNSSAIYGHFRGAERNTGQREGNITLCWFDHGWFWYIPLLDGTTSIGAVAHPSYFKEYRKGATLDDFLMQTIELAPKLKERLKNAEMVEPATTTGNYAYNSKFCRGDRFAMVGDAYAFVDPMFSSGVYLAMNSSFEAAEAVSLWLKGETRAAEKQFKRFEKVMVHGPKMFSWFIYRITSPAIREIFMQPRNIWRMQEALLSILAGDLFRNTPVWPRLMGFKFIYYAHCVSIWPQAFKTWLWRRRNVKAAAVEQVSNAVYVQDQGVRSESA
jgi:flavin-dependent dehydrogenase